MHLFDLHGDTAGVCYEKGYSLDVNPLHWDLTRVERYAPRCQVFAVWLPDDCRGMAAVERCYDTLHWLRAQAAALPERLTLITDRDSWNLAMNSRRTGAVLAVESGAALGGQLSTLAVLWELGVKLLTLTWNGANELGYGCGEDPACGLTTFGKQVVREMERLGMIVDVSHLNEAGFWDVAELAERPFLASHSVSRTVHDHPRNLSDDQFLEIVRRGGVVGLSFCGAHLGEQTPEAIYRHLIHFLELGGENAVALGGDLDGTTLPPEWGGVAVYEMLAEFLVKKGLPEPLVRRIFFENAANFLYNCL